MPRKTSKIPPWVGAPHLITAEDIERYKYLTGVRASLDREYPDGWGDNEVRKYILARRQLKLKNLGADVRHLRREERDREKQIHAITEKYLQYFISPSPNDLVALKELARIQMTLDLLDEKLKALALQGEVAPQDISTLSKVRSDAISSFQKIEKLLGIDRGSRVQQTDMVTEIDRIRRQARAVVEKRSRRITCDTCTKREGLVFNLGLVLWHFDGQLDFSFSATCPRCNSTLSLP